MTGKVTHASSPWLRKMKLCIYPIILNKPFNLAVSGKGSCECLPTSQGSCVTYLIHKATRDISGARQHSSST